MRNVLVTGSTSGFGLLLVREFLKNGDKVFATGRSVTSRKEVFAEERKTYGTQLVEWDLDVTSSEDIAAITKKLADETLDVLINNAGYGLFGPLETLTEKQIRDQFEVNVFAPIFLTKALLPILRKSKAKVFNLSSTFGFVGFPLGSAYCASKFAIEGLTESLAHELQPHGVQFCSIQPGGYRTKFAQNINWPGAENMTYSTQVNNFKNLQNKMATRTKFQDPIEVARGILKLSMKKQIPLRVQYGKDSRFANVVRSVLPDSLFFKVTNSTYNKVLLKEASH